MHIFYSLKKKNSLDWPQMPYLANTGVFFVTMVNYSKLPVQMLDKTIPSFDNQPDSQRNHQSQLNMGVCVCMYDEWQVLFTEFWWLSLQDLHRRENQECQFCCSCWLRKKKKKKDNNKGCRGVVAQGLGFSRVVPNSDSCQFVIGVRFLAPIANSFLFPLGNGHLLPTQSCIFHTPGPQLDNRENF